MEFSVATQLDVITLCQQAIEQSHLPVSLVTVERTHTVSGIAFIQKKQIIELSYIEVKQKYMHMINQQAAPRSLLHLVDLLMAYALERVRKASKRKNVRVIDFALLYKRRIWRSAVELNQQDVKTHMRNYTMLQLHDQQTTWKKGEQFLVLSHEADDLKQNLVYHMNRSRRFFRHQFKLYLHAMILIRNWRIHTHIYESGILTFHYKFEQDKTNPPACFFDKTQPHLHLYLPALVRTKPLDLSMSKSDFFFLTSVFEVAKSTTCLQELEERLKVFLGEDASAEDTVSILSVIEQTKQEMEKALSVMEIMLKHPSERFVRFKTYMMKDVELAKVLLGLIERLETSGAAD